MPAVRRCGFCGDSIEHRPGRAKFCSDRCRMSYHDAKLAGRLHLTPAVLGAATKPAPAPAKGNLSLVPPAAAPLRVVDPNDDESIYYVTRKELEAADKHNTPVGRAVLQMAKQLDNPGVNTLSAVASLNKQFNEMLSSALSDAAPEEDPVAELRRIRDGKRRDALGAG